MTLKDLMMKKLSTRATERDPKAELKVARKAPMAKSSLVRKGAVTLHKTMKRKR